MTYSGKFILFEGIDGSGKTTVISTVAQILNKDHNVLILKEPTNGKYGKKIRELQKLPDTPPIDDIMDLYLKDRSNDVLENLIPALKENKLILMDRYYYSNSAYQGAMGLSPESILDKNRKLNFPEPDLLIFLDLHPEKSLERAAKRINKGESNRECYEKLDFLKKVRKIYFDILPKTAIIIDADKSANELAKNIYMNIVKYLNE